MCSFTVVTELVQLLFAIDPVRFVLLALVLLSILSPGAVKTKTAVTL